MKHSLLFGQPALQAGCSVGCVSGEQPEALVLELPLKFTTNVSGHPFNGGHRDQAGIKVQAERWWVSRDMNSLNTGPSGQDPLKLVQTAVTAILYQKGGLQFNLTVGLCQNCSLSLHFARTLTGFKAARLALIQSYGVDLNGFCGGAASGTVHGLRLPRSLAQYLSARSALKGSSPICRNKPAIKLCEGDHQ